MRIPATYRQMQRLLLFCFLLIISSRLQGQESISLDGEWQFAIDRDDKGMDEKWFTKELADKISLPGSMAERGKGDDITLRTKWTGSIYDSSFFFRPSLAKYRAPDNLKIPFWLTPAKHYTGRAWYRKKIFIPATWKNKNLELFFERVHIQSYIWMDSTFMGKSNSLSTPHSFNINKLPPGWHAITVCIDNRIKDMNVGPDSHSVSDHTQGNWNGIIGKMYVRALPSISIVDVQVFPDIKNKLANIKLWLVNAGLTASNAAITVSAKNSNTEKTDATKELQTSKLVNAGDTALLELKLPMGSNMQLWDEFNPNLYRLTVIASANGSKDIKQYQFGMREFTVNGTQFMINGRPVFLRGTLDNCEFPLTGYPAMDEAGWEKIFRTARSYGLNHMRFHSWCPPEAAFIAADKMGFYLQPEAPTWPNHGTSVGDGRFIDQYIYEETNRMTRAYGNYASFCMLSAGNEPAGKNQATYLAGFVNYWKEKDRRRVYTGASVAMSWPLVPENQYMVKSGSRGLRWTNAEPETVSDYASAIKDFNVPYVTHEMGQWCVFPDFDEIKKYTGTYKARNFELFQQDLMDHGMGDQAKDFFMASGKLQALCYKAEIEKDLRTKGLAGFQLLGLQDFPGQGTALVGVLNAFWDSKAYINAKQFSRFCNATVPLAQLKKFTYTNNENFEAGIELFHFGKKDFENTRIAWLVKDDQGATVKEGNFDPATYPIGSVSPVGTIRFSLEALKVPAHYNLEVSVANTSIVNDWDFWVYPAELPRYFEPDNSGYYYCDSLNDTAKQVLERGGSVFLNAAGHIIKGKEIVMYFTPVFWNTSWFKMRPPHVTGMLIQNNHPAFARFPTTSHSDFQWWSIVHNAQVMHLEDFPKGFKPLVQPIDTWFMNRRLGLIFEARVGRGRLLVSSADLSPVSPYPANRQLYYSLQNYLLSKEFGPEETVPLDTIKDLFISPSKETWDAYTKDSPDELKPIQNNTKPKQ